MLTGILKSKIIVKQGYNQRLAIFRNKLCHHVVAYSIAIDTDVYGVKYRQP